MTYSFKPAAVLLALLGVTDVAFADAGDQISNVTLPIVGDGGFSIAADCSETLYYTNEETSELFVTDKNRIHNGRFSTVVAGTTDKLVFTEMAWDKGRGKLWAAALVFGGLFRPDQVQVYLLDPTTGEATFQFTALDANNMPTTYANGLAYDGTDNTV
jgi:outer membrane protein assembly factor BamB